MSAALALQRALRARLVASPAVTALVPAANILDRNQRPAPSPAIVLGEAQEVDEGSDLQRRQLRVYHTVHVWQRAPSLEGAMTICGAIRQAIGAPSDVGVMRSHILLVSARHLVDLRVSSVRTMRDPDGETSHGVVTIEALIEEPAS